MITIGQHNYEEFFLLYVDGELSASEHQAVEQFVQENPGLADELEILMQTKLRGADDSLVFSDKEQLFRNESDEEIHLTNYEERFLLYVDNEMNAEAREHTERFVLQHPDLQESFTLLKQTLLEPVTIAYRDKASLYRKEETKRPIIFLNWQRMAVAAVLIGIAVLTGMIYSNRSALSSGIAQLPVDKIPAKRNIDKTIAADNHTSSRMIANSLLADKTSPDQNDGNKNKITLKIKQQETASVSANDHKADQQIFKDNTQKTTAALYKNEPVIIQVLGNQDKATVNRPIPGNQVITANNAMIPAAHNEETTPSDKESLAQNIVYKELDTDDENKSLYLGSLEINKDKLRGLFRKASSFLRSKTKQEADRAETSSPVNTRALK